MTTAQLGLSRASDTALLQATNVQERVLVTRYRDFGNLVVVHGLATGVVYLRVLPYLSFFVCVTLGPKRRILANAESVQHHSPGQAHVSTTNVSAALGNGAVQWVGRASDSQLSGRLAEAEMGPTMRRSSAIRDGQGRRISGSAHRARLLAFGLKNALRYAIPDPT